MFIINYAVQGFVLIDTWWNVNYLQRRNILRVKIVLIDTWWNVNLTRKEEVSTLIEF